MAATSPRITSDGWGRITVDGRTYKDVMLWPGGAAEWDWNRTGTSHDGGVQAADVRTLLDRGAAHVVLSRGRQGRLTIHRDALALLDERDVPHDVLDTADAIVRYEERRSAGDAVAALIHTTC